MIAPFLVGMNSFETTLAPAKFQFHPFGIRWCLQALALVDACSGTFNQPQHIRLVWKGGVSWWGISAGFDTTMPAVEFPG